MKIKCTICGFSENTVDKTNCIKCGEALEKPSVISELSMDEHEVSNLTSLINKPKPEPIVVKEDLKSTRIVQDAKEKVDVPKETLFVEEFDIDKEKRLALELYPIGEDDSAKALRFFDDNITLTRKDVDDQDLSISSKDHVQFYKTEKGWKMKNLSSNGAVFIRVVGEVELFENDIVIIGKNKTFLFKPRK